MRVDEVHPPVRANVPLIAVCIMLDDQPRIRLRTADGEHLGYFRTDRDIVAAGYRLQSITEIRKG